MRFSLLTILFLSGIHSVFSGEILREQNLEILLLGSGETARKWNTAEATVTSATRLGAGGKSALRLHIEVDHHGGEAKYPVGWPRALRDLTEDWERNWSEFDFFQFRVRAESSRESLPKRALGLILYAPDKAHSYNRPVEGLVLGEWVDVRIPVPEITRGDPVKRIQFFVNESDYAHGDALDFFVDGLRLVRHAKPHLYDVALRPTVCFSDAGTLRVAFRVLGVPPGQTVEARVELLRGGERLMFVRKDVARGENEVFLSQGKKALEVGDYTVRVRIGNGGAVERILRVVESPFRFFPAH